MMIEKIIAICKKYREYVLYLLFGAGTTLVSWLSYYGSRNWLLLSVVVSNIISWILAVAFAYLTNRKWVFDSKAHGAAAICKEAGSFAAARLLTLGIETVMLWLSVDILHFPDMLMKILVSIIVLVLNYIFSKWIVFRSGNN